MLLPIPKEQRRALSAELRKNKKKRSQAISPPKSNEVKYRKRLVKLSNKIQKSVVSRLIPLLVRLESSYIKDAPWYSNIEKRINDLRNDFNNIGKFANVVSASFVKGVNSVNKERFYNSMNTATGINTKKLIKDEDLEDVLFLRTKENVNLIKTIPEEYFAKLNNIVYEGVLQGNSAKSMITQIKDLGHSTTYRAKRIARDQASKLNASLTEERAQKLNVNTYIWRTAGDDRVRDTHRANNGKVFSFDNPPKATGNPSDDINCRCVAELIVNI